MGRVNCIQTFLDFIYIYKALSRTMLIYLIEMVRAHEKKT